MESLRRDVIATLAREGSVPVIGCEALLDRHARADLTKSGRVGMEVSSRDGTYHYVLTRTGRAEAHAARLDPAPHPDWLVTFNRDGTSA